MNVSLKRFYQELQAWIEGGFQHHPIFSMDNGICNQLDAWARRQPDIYSWEVGLYHVALEEEFKSAGLHDVVPFNLNRQNGNMNDAEPYVVERSKGKLWENPKRLAWVKARSL